LLIQSFILNQSSLTLSLTLALTHTLFLSSTSTKFIPVPATCHDPHSEAIINILFS
jgi:hypothetical protein